MKTKQTIGLLGGAMLGLFICALGCSDGELPSQGGTTLGGGVVEPPTCNSFTASPEVVQAGGQATLAWEVEGADSIEIAASGVETKFSYSTTSEFSASTVVADIQETTIFVLTATKLPPKEGEVGGEETPAGGMVVKEDQPADGTEEGTAPAEPQTCRMTTKVTVEGAAQALSIGRFDAEALEVDAGDKTVLHWEVTPADAEVSLASSTGEQPVAGDCNAETTDELELEGEVSEVLPASGCASIQPMEDTIYTLTASAGGETTSQDLSITVVKAPRIDSFLANGSASLKVSAYPAAVTLAWKVKPSLAKVTITSSGGVEEPLPQGLTQTEGEISVMVRQDTTFTLTASVEGQSDATAQVAVTSDLSGLDCATQFLVAGPTTPVFEGEKVRLSWEIPAAASNITAVRVQDSSGEVLGTVDRGSNSLEVEAKAGGYSVAFVSSGGADYCSKTVNVSVAAFDGPTGGKAVRVVKDPSAADRVYVGYDLEGYNKGVIRVVHYPDTDHPIDIEFFKVFKTYSEVTGAMNETFMNESIKTFPVNAIAKSADGTLFVATTGVILYQKPETKEWKVLTTLLRVDDEGNYPGSHPTCFGKEQSGQKSSFRGQIVSLGQVCDMEVVDGRLYAATDRGLYYLDDASSGKGKWVGKSTDNPTYAKVVNDILVDGSAVYAASSAGVFKSADGGMSWESLKEGAAYSVATTSTMDSTIITVGTDSGVYVKDTMGADWTLKLESGAIYSVIADPYAPGVIYAGGASGLYVSRDGGESFAKASPEGLSGNVRSIAVLYSEDPTALASKYYIYLATDSGVMKANLSQIRLDLSKIKPLVSEPPLVQ